MKVIVYNDRDLNVIEEYSTQNENDFEVMEFKFSSLFDNYNKKIVFLTPDGNISYYISNNIFFIPREITQYEQVKFYIWCTFEDKDFRTKLKILSFYKNENVNIDILPLEKAQIEQIINELEKNILIVQNLEKQTTNLIDEIETKLKNGDFIGPQGETGPQGPPGPQGETGPQGPQGDPGESYDDTEIKEELSDIKEEQLSQNTDIETLETQVEDLEEQVQELENNQLTGTATGQSIYIEDSTNTKVRDIGLSGNSEQDGTPTPDNPVEIHSTGDSGSVNEKVQNKNLFDVQKWVLQGNNSNYYSYENGKLYINALDTRTMEVFTEADRIYLPNGNYYLSNISSAGIRIYNNDNNTNVSTNQFTVTLGYIYLKLVSSNVISCIPMIEQGTEATSYEPHKEQTIQFPLAEGQKLMEGDYLADDGIHHVRGEKIYTAEDITYFSDSYTNLNVCRIQKPTDDIKYNNVVRTKTVLCNKLIYDIRANGYDDVNLIGKIYDSGDVAYYIGLPKTITSLAEAQTYLGNFTLQYELATEVIDPYTEEQQAVWEQIKALRTYKPVTHISSTDEVPATVDVTYVKDLETVINNLGGA